MFVDESPLVLNTNQKSYIKEETASNYENSVKLLKIAQIFFYLRVELIFLAKKNEQVLEFDSNNQRRQCKNFDKCKGKGSTDLSRKSHRKSKYCPLNETAPEQHSINKM